MKNYELKLEKMIADFKDDLTKELIEDDMTDHVIGEKLLQHAFDDTIDELYRQADYIWEQIDRWTYEYIKHALQEHKSEIIREIRYQCNIQEDNDNG